MKKRTLFLLFMLTIFISSDAFSQCMKNVDGNFVSLDGNECINNIFTATPFLRIVPDARSGAMGGSGIAISPNANAMHFNASNLAFADNTFGISFNYNPWLKGLGLKNIYLAYLSSYIKIGNTQAIGLGLRYFSLGDIIVKDLHGQQIGSARPNEFEIKLSYALQLSSHLSMGIGGKYIHSDIGSGFEFNGTPIEKGRSFAGDISFTYETPVTISGSANDFRLGLALTNLGSKISYLESSENFIPANIGLGMAWDFHLNQQNNLVIVVDINKLLVPTPCLENCDENANGIDDTNEQSVFRSIVSSFGDAPGGGEEELKELMYSFGLEYSYNNIFFCRTGYYTEHVTKGNRKYLTAGIGVKQSLFDLNFSYLIPVSNEISPLDNTMRFSLLLNI